MTELLVGRYEIVSSQEEGPLGILHRASMIGGSTYRPPVAVRALHPALAANARFVRTWATAASRLAEVPSPHVERMLDVALDGPDAYVVTEWIEGLSVAKWLRAHRTKELEVPWPLALEIAIEALRALREAHPGDPPILHGGVSTESLRIARDGTVKLTRFGAVEAFARTGASRYEMEVLGLAHPSPESVRGEVISYASDLFGVGALLFELLAGKPPFDAEPGDARDEQIVGLLPDLSSVRSDVPPLVVALVERALHQDPALRFESADAMVKALAQLIRSHPVAVGPEALARSSQEITIPRELLETDTSLLEKTSAAAALPASLRAMTSSEIPVARPKSPTGLLERQNTMRVEASELTELAAAEVVITPSMKPASVGSPPVDEPEVEKRAEIVRGKRTPAIQPQRTRRYDFTTKKKGKPARAGLTQEESVAMPLLLTKVNRAKSSEPAAADERPVKGLAPSTTEMLDFDEVERLTMNEAAPTKPEGLVPQKTEMLDEDQVDRLTIEPKPKGLTPQQTEMLDADQVDLLKIDD